MKGIVLAGGTGSRLLPLTTQINKHLLPVYDKPMIYYPILTLRNSGIKDIMIILGGNSVGEIVQTIGDGSTLGVNVTYKYQSKPDGIAGALKLVKEYVQEEPFAVILGDNIFENYFYNLENNFLLSLESNENKPTAMIVLSPTDKPQSFGIATLDKYNNILNIIEKPEKPESNMAVTGFYVYDKHIWSMIETLQLSKRNEFEITDINNWYIKNGLMIALQAEGYWADCGSIESLYKTINIVYGYINGK